jgi:hypothetical protein
MNLHAKQVAGSAIARLIHRMAEAGEVLDWTDAPWVTDRLIALLQPHCLPNGTVEQCAVWFCEWLPEIEAELPG